MINLKNWKKGKNTKYLEKPLYMFTKYTKIRNIELEILQKWSANGGGFNILQNILGVYLEGRHEEVFFSSPVFLSNNFSPSQLTCLETSSIIFQYSCIYSYP
jgi:hypothetical protein